MIETHFKEGDINEELIDKMVRLSRRYCCWHQHFSSQIFKFGYIKKYKYRLSFDK